MILKKFLSLAALGVLITAGGCTRQSDEGDGPPTGATEVEVIEVQPIAVSHTDQLPGRVVAYQVAEIRPQVSGIIQQRLFEEGTLVEEGQQLYQIEPARYQADLQLAEATLDEAQARLANAELQANRFEELIEKKTISQQQYDDAIAALNRAKASVGIAEAQVRRAQINLDFTSVNSPISGYISPSSVTKGALVTESQQEPLAIVRQLDPVYVDLAQTAADVRTLKQQLAAARREAGERDKFPVTLYLGQDNKPYPQQGFLDATDFAVDLQTGSIRLRALFPNPDTVLLPGMFVRAVIEDVGRGRQIVVPQKAVNIDSDGSKSVWLVDSAGNARKQAVRTGATVGNNWIIEDGLAAGDRVIISGAMKLREGSAVTVSTGEQAE